MQQCREAADGRLEGLSTHGCFKNSVLQPMAVASQGWGGGEDFYERAERGGSAQV